MKRELPFDTTGRGKKPNHNRIWGRIRNKRHQGKITPKKTDKRGGKKKGTQFLGAQPLARSLKKGQKTSHQMVEKVTEKRSKKGGHREKKLSRAC